MMNAIKRRITLRFGWLVLLLILLTIFAFILVMRGAKSDGVKNNIIELKAINENYQKIDSCISILYIAENNSRLFAVTADTSYLKQFTQGIAIVYRLLNDYQQTSIQNEGNKNIGNLLKKKNLLNTEFLHLRNLTDSLVYNSNHLASINNTPPIFVLPKDIIRESNYKVDSVKLVRNKKSRRLFVRIVDAIKNKEENDEQYTTSSSEKKSTEVASSEEDQVKGNYNRIIDYYGNYLKHREELNRKERELLLLNDQIFGRLQQALSEIRNAEEQEVIDQRKNLLRGTLEDLDELDELDFIPITVVGILTIIILINVWRLYKSDLDLLNYSKQATTYAKMKGDFLATMSHEIRTPLNSIIGFSEQMTLSELPVTQRSNLEAIRSSSGILLNLVNDILDFSKFESGKITLSAKPFKPYEICTEVLSILSVLSTNRGVTLDSKLEFDRTIVLEGDAFRVKQVLMNLLSNAIKFTPQGGTVTLYSNVSIVNNGQAKWSILVEDTGIGIDKEQQKLIFNDFHQIDLPDGVDRPIGTGLGLAICKRIVDIAGGKIEVSSTLGKGSVFTVELPLKVSTAAPVAVTTKKLRTIGEMLANKKVLIVDDNKMNMLLLSMILKKNGVSFEEAANGKIAFDLFEQRAYDLIITDIQMPVMDGITLVKQIRNYSNPTKAQTPIVGFTAQVSPEDQEHYLAIGMNRLLVKPFVDNDLKEILADLVS